MQILTIKALKPGKSYHALSRYDESYVAFVHQGILPYSVLETNKGKLKFSGYDIFTTLESLEYFRADKEVHKDLGS